MAVPDNVRFKIPFLPALFGRFLIELCTITFFMFLIFRGINVRRDGISYKDIRTQLFLSKFNLTYSLSN